MDEDMPEIPDSVSRVLAEASKNWTLQVTSITKQMSSAISAATIARDVAKRMQLFQDAIRIHSVLSYLPTTYRNPDQPKAIESGVTLIVLAPSEAT